MSSPYNNLTPSSLQYFRSLLGEENIFTDKSTLEDYSHDYTEDLSFLPEVVLKPNTTEEVSKILSYCNEHLIPVTPRGAGTGLSGGALPVMGGVSLSAERFNRILKIDKQNFQATVEPGVINEVFQKAVE